MELAREALRDAVLGWYRERKRDLPFRRTRDPYAILVAEFILQRTRVAAGLPYYERFMAAFPTVRDLAAATEADVLRHWEGLGFYRRAQNLHRAATTIVHRHGGEVPADPSALRALPGIGDYTAGAVGSIAFGLPVPAVDGNVSRVLARLYRIEERVDRGPGRARVRSLAADLVPADVPGEWNQALMELGATVCTPRAPRCETCPLAEVCAARAAGIQESLPRSAPKASTPVVPVVFAVVRRGDDVLLVRRRAGLHAGMYALPGGERGRREGAEDAIRRHLAGHGVHAVTVEPITRIRHAFSHLRWDGVAYRCRVRGAPREAEWIALNRLADLPLVPVHRRVLDAPRNVYRA